MTTQKKPTLRDKLGRLKKALQKVFRNERHPVPQLVLEPARRRSMPKEFFGNMMVTRDGSIRTNN